MIRRNRVAAAAFDVLIGVLVVVAVVVGVVALLWMDPWGDRASDRNRRADAELRKAAEIDPDLIRYEQAALIKTGLKQVRSLAVGANDDIYVAGDRVVRVFNAKGARQRDISLSGLPRRLAIGNEKHEFPGRLYVAVDDHIVPIDAEGRPEPAWESLGENADLTSVAAGPENVYVADAGNRKVWRFDTSGKLLGQIGDVDPEGDTAGFVIPSPYFDVAIDPAGLLYVVNPGKTRLELYTPEGERGAFWGKASSAVDGFYGCCNPAHFAILPDGRFVTAEKGLPRIKIYSEDGRFECVVAGPKQVPKLATDVAADSQGRVLILDASIQSIRVFQPKATNDGETP